jgi:hypothetical protein
VVCFHDVMLYVVVMMMMMVMNVEWGVWIVDCGVWTEGGRRWRLEDGVVCMYARYRIRVVMGNIGYGTRGCGEACG